MKKLCKTYDSIVLVMKDRDDLQKAITRIQSADLKILDIQMPHYVNFKTMSAKKDRFGYIAGISGLAGFIMATLVIMYVMDKPHLIFGNKELPWMMKYIPVLFTFSILGAGIGLLVTFSFRNHLLPGQQNQVIDRNTTTDHFLLILQKTISQEQLKEVISGLEFTNIYEIEFIKQNVKLPIPLKIR